MLHRTDMHYYNIEEIGMRNRYYRTAAIKAAVIYFMGFSLLSMSEFFVFRKMETCETKNHPLCGCESRSYTKSPFRFIIEVSKPLSKKGKVIYMAKKANDLAHTKVQFIRDYTG